MEPEKYLDYTHGTLLANLELVMATVGEELNTFGDKGVLSH